MVTIVECNEYRGLNLKLKIDSYRMTELISGNNYTL